MLGELDCIIVRIEGYEMDKIALAKLESVL